MDGKVAALKIQEAARTAEIVQQMAIDMEEIGIVTDMRNDVLVPDFGQQRAAGLFQWPVLLLAFMAGGIRRGPRFARLAIQASASLYQSTAGRWSARA
jgi:hypothetical protein